MIRERDQRTGQATGVKIDRLLSDVLLSELLTPSEDLWLMSPWITDIEVLNNTGGVYDSAFNNPLNRTYLFAEILGLLTHAGSMLRVITRTGMSVQFLDHLQHQANPDNLRIIRDETIYHEKTFCGDDWQITGSMNYTFHGMHRNDERSRYLLDPTSAALTRVEFTQRFGGQPWE
ncbi:phospholipase D-like domain-containing protein DpdK [Mycolicibacterium fortuitum]|uniref:phospholipase D-like domain-containing protein DpdK n=1 Tax=Mycolicibacterium fortuitum TaxID=1766 RepID=UPI001CDC2540|nr:phospholipase D-like domain-containing protein DpdK [Mycolicibacterium fortuitum]UBV22725.1 phosphatidylserine/phosphatidylglycerophosphate/cardiolipin synthase family protein [Mycolicibacterium fortuitum]